MTSSAGVPISRPGGSGLPVVLNVTGLVLYGGALGATRSTTVLIAAAVAGAALLSVPGRDRPVDAARYFKGVGVTSTWARAATNFVFTLLLLAGTALAVHHPAHVSGPRKAVIGVAFGLPVLVVVLTTGRTVRWLIGSPRTEFEASLLINASALSFPIVAGLALTYSLCESFAGAPPLRGWWVVGAVVVVYSTVQNTVRHQMTR